VETCSDFEKACQSSFDFNTTLGGFGDPTEDFEERTFPRTISSDDAHDSSPCHFEAKIADGPEILDTGRRVCGFTLAHSKTIPDCSNCVFRFVRQNVSKSHVAVWLLFVPDSVFFPKAGHSYYGFSHGAVR
jgi:hypothetical protein